MLLTFVEYLKTCQLEVGDYCVVVGGYAKNFSEIVFSGQKKYHRIPLMTLVQVINVDEDCCTVKWINQDDDSNKGEVKQIMFREDLIYQASVLN